ncbi:MAG: hypothetical protein LBS29_02915 [Endomicrobium sp.]|jgi:hypothetical protein|uniref:hypothetical protein n=1 Tax=Candidatus Endomicrobiellum cubanum TaxID=3242325 RepID=UPI00282D9B57|nr:hypothetical protein [Endomicrobium sp.]MDR2396099.1 hypothetical protein [Endomicrobium sp.]
MLKEKDSLYEILGKFVLISAVGCSCFVIAKAFLNNDEKKAAYLQKRLRQSYDGLSPEEY